MTLLGALVDRLTSNGHGLEDNVARSALTKTLHTLFDEHGVTDGGLAALREMSVEDAQNVISECIARYIDERVLHVLGDGLQSLPVVEILLREAEVKDYIRNRLRMDLRDIDILRLDWGSAEATALIERIFTEAHRLLQHS
jgi:hypothetical protein